VPWPLNRREAEGDLVLLQNFLFSYINVDVHGSIGMRITRFADIKLENWNITRPAPALFPGY